MNKVNNILAKVGWKTRKWDYQFELITINLGKDEEFGFRCLTIYRKYRRHSLVSLFISLPNRTTRQRFWVDEWDIAWSRNAMWRWYDRTTDNLMWSRTRPGRWTALRLRILDRLFK